MSALHSHEKSAQSAARASGRTVYVGRDYGGIMLKVKARKRLVGYEMKYLRVQRDGRTEVPVTRRCALLIVEACAQS